MKKYLLLASLFFATVTLGALAYTNVNSASEPVVLSEKSNSFTKVSEEETSSVVEASKEIAQEATESVARFLFSLIYK